MLYICIAAKAQPLSSPTFSATTFRRLTNQPAIPNRRAYAKEKEISLCSAQCFGEAQLARRTLGVYKSEGSFNTPLQGIAWLSFWWIVGRQLPHLEACALRSLGLIRRFELA